MMELILSLDRSILSAVSGWHTPFLDFWIPKLTVLGNGGILWVVLGIALLFFRRTRACGQTLLFALLLTLLLGNCLLKPLIARPRPFAADASVSLLIPTPTDASFPSGHTYSGIASAIVLWRHKRLWGACALCLALAIAFSRLYLTVHFPTDILGGVLLGVLASALALAAEKNRLRHRSELLSNKDNDTRI